MEILDALAPALAVRAVRAVDIVRAVEFGAVQRDQGMAAQYVHPVQTAALAQSGEDIGEDREKMRRIERVEHGADRQQRRRAAMRRSTGCTEKLNPKPPSLRIWKLAPVACSHAGVAVRTPLTPLRAEEPSDWYGPSKVRTAVRPPSTSGWRPHQTARPAELQAPDGLARKGSGVAAAHDAKSLPRRIDAREKARDYSHLCLSCKDNP